MSLQPDNVQTAGGNSPPIGQPPDANNPPRRRRSVQVSHTAITTDQVDAARESHAQSIAGNPAITNPTPQQPPATFDPRTDFARRKNNIPTPENNQPNMDDVVRAFQRAGQTAEMRRPPPPAKPAGVIAGLADQLPTPDKIMNDYRVHESISDNPLAFREVLPSNGVFYQWPALELRPFEVPEYAKLYRARQENDESILIDTVAAVCSVDVRSLTMKDFRYLMYKLRIQSSLKAPYKVAYTSMYGNRCEYTINNTNLKTDILNSTAEEYAEWQAKGLCMPTLRDVEEYNQISNQLGKEGEFLWTRAKYVPGNSVREKIHRLNKMPPNFLFEEIENFALKFERYGVTETVQLSDNKFEPRTALATLNSELGRIDAALGSSSMAVASAELLFNKRADLVKEISRIETALQTSGEAAPLSETIEFSIEIADFFPTL